jgi:transposase
LLFYLRSSDSYGILPAMHEMPSVAADLRSVDRETLAALVLAQQEKLLSCVSEIEHLKLIIAKLRRMMFGTKSEKVAREIEQLELKLEELEVRKAERAEAGPGSEPPSRRPSRQPLPEYLPREVHVHMPDADMCTACGGELSKLGEDVSEMLEYVPASFKVIRHVRPKLCCTKCDVILEAPAPSRPIERGLAGPGLLAHVLVAKYADHLPLYRQSEIYPREGVDLDRSTLADWVGAASHLLSPLVDQLRRHVLAGSKLHADDTPMPVLAPGRSPSATNWGHAEQSGSSPLQWQTDSRTAVQGRRESNGHLNGAAQCARWFFRYLAWPGHLPDAILE